MASLSALANKWWHNHKNIFRQLHRDCNIQTDCYFSRDYATKIALGTVVICFNVFMKMFCGFLFCFCRLIGWSDGNRSTLVSKWRKRNSTMLSFKSQISHATHSKSFLSHTQKQDSPISVLPHSFLAKVVLKSTKQQPWRDTLTMLEKVLTFAVFEKPSLGKEGK